MFAYCNNNPIVRVDSSGTLFFTIVGTVIGAAMGALGAVIEGKSGDELKAAVLASATSGAIAGMAADVLAITGGTAGVVALTMAGAGALGALASNYVEATVLEKEMDWKATARDMVWDGSCGALFGYMGGAIGSKFSMFAKKGFIKALGNIAKGELDEIATTVVEEILGNVTAGLGRFAIKYYYSSFVEENIR